MKIEDVPRLYVDAPACPLDGMGVPHTHYFVPRGHGYTDWPASLLEQFDTPITWWIEVHKPDVTGGKVRMSG